MAPPHQPNYCWCWYVQAQGGGDGRIVLCVLLTQAGCISGLCTICACLLCTVHGLLCISGLCVIFCFQPPTQPRLTPYTHPDYNRLTPGNRKEGWPCVLYDPAVSERGALLSVSRVARQRDPFDFEVGVCVGGVVCNVHSGCNACGVGARMYTPPHPRTGAAHHPHATCPAAVQGPGLEETKAWGGGTGQSSLEKGTRPGQAGTGTWAGGQNRHHWRYADCWCECCRGVCVLHSPPLALLKVHCSPSTCSSSTASCTTPTRSRMCVHPFCATARAVAIRRLHRTLQRMRKHSQSASMQSQRRRTKKRRVVVGEQFSSTVLHHSSHKPSSYTLSHVGILLQPTHYNTVASTPSDPSPLVYRLSLRAIHMVW